jgi:hypothetical protein
MATGQGTFGPGAVLRRVFGMALFLFWGLETVLWVYGAIHALTESNIGPAVRAACALLLMALLAGMEGLEVAVIDRWREMYPDRSTSELAGWLAARQLFVALIVTTATLLAEPDSIAIPFSSTAITGGFVLKAFTITWTGFTVLWFMQIFPKHLAATNPDRYLRYTQPSLFPIVEVVRRIGVSQPGEWVAQAVENRLDWHAEPSIEEAPLRRASLADIWAALIPESRPARGLTPEERPEGGPTES